MKRNGWHIHRTEACYTLARQWPPHFDISATARFPKLRRGRLAQQIRQDMWRALRNLRGFSPVVEVCDLGSELEVTAGGRLPKPIPSSTTDALSALLTDPFRRARWIDWAREDTHDA